MQLLVQQITVEKGLKEVQHLSSLIPFCQTKHYLTIGFITSSNTINKVTKK